MIEKRGRNKTIVCDECNTNRTTCMQNLDSLLELAKQKGWKNSTHKYGDHTAHINVCPQCQRGETKLIFTQSKAASKVLTQKTDKELDTHVGSASSLIACHDMGFDAVGFELDEDYYKQSKKRLEQHQRQISLEDMENLADENIHSRTDDRATTIQQTSFL